MFLKNCQINEPWKRLLVETDEKREVKEFKNFVFWVWICEPVGLTVSSAAVVVCSTPTKLKVYSSNGRSAFIRASSQSQMRDLREESGAANHRGRCTYPCVFSSSGWLVFTAEWAEPNQVRHDFCQTSKYTFRFTFWMFYTNLWMFK